MSKKHAFALELKISPKGRRPSIFISKTHTPFSDLDPEYSESCLDIPPAYLKSEYLPLYVQESA